MHGIISIYNGKGKSGKYKTLFTEAFECYVVTGIVLENGLFEIGESMSFLGDKITEPEKITVSLEYPKGTELVLRDNYGEWDVLLGNSLLLTF